MPFTESNYEKAVLKLFTDVLGYSYAYGSDIDQDYHNPLYEDLLFPALQRINPGAPHGGAERGRLQDQELRDRHFAPESKSRRTKSLLVAMLIFAPLP